MTREERLKAQSEAREMNRAAELEMFRSMTIAEAVSVLGFLLDDGRSVKAQGSDLISNAQRVGASAEGP